MNTILFCYEKAALQHHLDAITDLGHLYEKGLTCMVLKITEPNLHKALSRFIEAKKQRHPRALNSLAFFYLSNVNNPEIPEKAKGDKMRKALKYFEMAENAGNVNAVYNIG